MGQSDDSWDFKVSKKKSDRLKKKAYQKEKSRRVKEDLFEEKYNKIDVEGQSLKRKSRSQLAKEYEREEDKKKPPHPDEIYGSAIRRGLALGIDLFICILLMGLVLTYYAEFWIALELEFFKLETYGLGSLLTYFGSLLASLYIVTCLFPNIVFGKSFGKALMGVKTFAKGEQYHSLNYLQGLLREIVFKPLSLISIIGVLMSYLGPERKMLHDYLSGSVVRRQ